MEPYLNSKLSPRERAEDLLQRMSLEEKMAQTGCVLVPIGMEEKAASYLRYGIGEISCLEVRNFKTTEEAVRYQRRLQKTVLENSPHGIPAIFHMEGLCGAFIIGAASFPNGIGRAASFDPELEEKIGRCVSRQENAAGITHTLAPVLDISRDSRMGRQAETYGEDPTLAAVMGTAYARGLQEEEIPVEGGTRRVEGIAKHFLGFHNSEAGIHGAASDTTERLLYEVYGKPFQAAIHDAHLRGIMPCYCSLNGEPLSVSKKILTGLLRDEMGFDGVVLSDYSAIENVHNVQHLYESLGEAGYHAMEAGMDIDAPVPQAFGEELKKAFAEGKADTAVLDRAVRDVLEAKFRMGLFEHPYALEGEAFRKVFFHEDDRKLSDQSALESMILMKNDGALPLSGKVRKIALIGPHADNARSFFGGYTHISMVEAVHAAANSMAGIDGAGLGERNAKEIRRIPGTMVQSDDTEEFKQILKDIKPDCRSLRQELEARGYEVVYAQGYPIAGADDAGYEKALAAMDGCDAVILTLGGKYGSGSIATMGEGVDGVNINLPACQENFIPLARKKAEALGIPLVGVHLDGRPISSDAADRDLDAILEAFSPSEGGAAAIADVLTGKENPCGRLPVSVAYTAGQIPIYYNHPSGSSWDQGESIGFANYVDLTHRPRYAFGHGLSYTTFAYSDFAVDKESVASDGTFSVSFTLQNTGDRDGTEIAQLYVRDSYARMVRPVKELAGFARVFLRAGEAKRITFTLQPSQFAYLDEDMHWLIEKGNLELMAGAASDDIRLTGAIRVSDSRIIAGRDRGFAAETKVEEIR